MSAEILTEFDRFLAALPESKREEWRERIAPSGLPADHTIFGALADLLGISEDGAEEEPGAEPPDFLQEAQLHSSLSKEILANFAALPGELKAAIEAKLTAIEQAARPLMNLSAMTDRLGDHVEHLGVLFPPGPPPAAGPIGRLAWRSIRFIRATRDVLGNAAAWVVAGTVSLSLASIVAVVILYFGAATLQRHYEDKYQQRLSGLTALVAQDSAALTQLAMAGVRIELRRHESGDGYFLLLKGARKAAQPVNTPDGLAVQFWP